ncbi:MAG: MBL fold metallo-hydrolase, partial [Chloroflexi bacterium]|nr:MBL fold metallo-hydrolase [Chloroflexota bacterium]
MKLIVHRGTREIGGSCVEVRSGASDARIVIDLGMPLVQADRSPFEWRRYEQMSVEDLLKEGVLPPVSGLYAHETPTVQAVLISHAHQDHYGLLRFIHPEIPVYCSAGTRTLIEVSNIFLNTAVDVRQIKVLSMWKAVNVGDFRVTPYLVDHSAPDAVAFVVEVGGRKLFYSGDFRGHGRKKVLLERMLNNPVSDVDCLLLEGTMLGRSEGDYQTEDDVEEAVREVIESTGSYTFIFASSQNLDRLVSVYRAAIRCGAIFVIDLYTAFVLDRLKPISPNIPQANWRNVRVLYTRYHANKLAAIDRRYLFQFRGSKIGLPELRSHKGRAVFFYRDNSYFRRMLRHLGSLETARGIYSMWPGYLKRSDLEDVLHSHGIELTMIHTSGHAVESDLKNLVSALDPGCVVPMHTFHPDQYRSMFQNVITL